MKNSTIDKTKVDELDELDEVKVVKKSRITGNKTKKKNKKGNMVVNVFTVLFSLGTMGIIMVLFLLYGPYYGFREWLVTTAMTTMTHQYFATWFYDEDTINYILDKNKIVEIDETTDANAINFGYTKFTDYKNEFERAII